MSQERHADAVCESNSHLSHVRMTRHFVLVAALCVGLFSLGRPEVAGAAGGYAGFGIGGAWSTVDKDSVKFDTLDFSPNATAWRVFGGYQTGDNLAVEAGYISLGKDRVTDQGGDYFEAEVTGFELTPVGLLPIGKGLSLFARAGAVFWHSDISYRYAVLGSGTSKESGTSLALSLGADYAFGSRWGARAEYSLYAIDKAKAGAGDFGVMSISGTFAF